MSCTSDEGLRRHQHPRVFVRFRRPKQRRATELLESHTRAGETLLSTQVLQEFYVPVTRKLATPIELGVAHEAVRELAVLPTVRVDVPLIHCQRYR